MIPSMLIASCLLGVDPGVAERGIRKTGTDRSTDYSEKWALIVGVGDYTGKAKLKNPVNDAEAMRGILEKYGFKNKDRVAVLTDKAATHQAVSAALDKLCHKDKVNSNACVLVFFAGHGSAEAKDTSLLLYDTTYATDGSPVEKLRLADLRKKLIDDCPAKHKLLILDCCHAGNVFRLDGEAYDPLNPIPAEGTFETAKVTQAIVSTWANQQAADADRTNPNNSPFTGSLVAALDSIPRDLPKSDDPLKSHYHFTTSKLFATLQSRLLENRSTAGQTAVCMSLDRQRQGEFHFFPDRDAKFTERFDKETLLLAMTPTTFGNWWADEVPWFMPGLRNEILTRPPSTRSTLVNQLGRKQLIAAAQEVMAEMMKSEDETKKCRAKHLELLLGSGQVGSRHQAIHEVIAQLRTIVGRSKLPDPLDLHYLAVLEHKQGHKLEAAANYTAALERYAELIEKDKKAKSAAPPAETNTPSREKASPHRTLYALCLADQATFFLLVANDYVKAAKGFNSAWEVYAEYAPAPFKVYTRLKEAEAYRRLGFTGLTADRLRAAEDAISTADADWETPLAAATLKNSAWADMEQWNFKAARDKFEEGRARLLRLGKLDPQDEYAIDELHIEHGLAMIERFQGESEKSLRRYRELTAKIVQKIEDLDRRRVQSNYVEIRYLLYARLVNSLQRQADCSLFAPTPDYAEAADDYRRALLQVGNMDDDVREGEKVRLLYCRAIALAARSPTQDLDRARHMFADAEAIVIDKKMKVLPVQVEICRSIAHTLLGLEKTQEATVAVPGAGSSSAKDPVGFKIKCAELSRDSRTFDRDELERMMFGYRLLIEAQIAALSRGTSKVASRTALEEAEASKERHEWRWSTP